MQGREKGKIGRKREKEKDRGGEGGWRGEKEEAEKEEARTRDFNKHLRPLICKAEKRRIKRKKEREGVGQGRESERRKEDYS